MPIKRRSVLPEITKRSKTSRVKPNPRLRRVVLEPEDERVYVDSIEEYIFSIPKNSLPYTRLVVDWILPYQENQFTLFGLFIRITPRYRHTLDGNVTVTGLLCEIKKGNQTVKGAITGPRGTWHGKIKFFAKSNVDG